MQFENEFTVAGGIDEVWPVLLDLNRVVPCLPGASLDSVDGDAFKGRMRIRLGPMQLSYGGEGTMTPDAAAKKITVDARGSEQRGSGSANATIVASLGELSATRTQVVVVTDLDITGKPAQFGRGIMAEVANKMIATFASNLQAQLAAASEASTSTSGATTAGEPATVGAPAAQPTSEPLDLLGMGATPMLKKAGAAVGAGLALLAFTVLVRRRCGRKRT